MFLPFDKVSASKLKSLISIGTPSRVLYFHRSAIFIQTLKYEQALYTSQKLKKKFISI